MTAAMITRYPAMIRKPVLLLACIVFAFAGFVPAASAAKLKIPRWLAEASLRQVSETKNVSAVILHNEEIYTVLPGGLISITTRGAVRVMTSDGRPSASAVAPYDASSSRLTDFRAWLVRPDATGKAYYRNDGNDVATSREAVYAELRRMELSASKDAFAGCVFGYEYTIEDRGVFGQQAWSFQSEHPVALSRITYKIPKGWSLTSSMVNHEPVQPVVKDTTYTWEMRDMPSCKREPFGPSLSRIAPRMNIDLIPPPGAKNPPRISFSGWADVSAYLTALYAKPCMPDATVEAKARELLAAAGPGAWERINALARHAQAVNYVQIAMNVGRGGGYTPRAASEVLRTGYGDCKDKTALLRAMLKVAGIDSYSVTVYSGDRHRVTDAWPTPMQFNHAITAIKIDDPAIQSPSIMTHPVFGRLLFFDPTDPFTPLGDLDYEQQGSLVLVLAGGEGALVRLPFTSPEANHLARKITAGITAAGAINGSIVERYTGQSAAGIRGVYRSGGGKFSDLIRDWINGTVRAVKLLKTDVVDDQERGTFDMTAEFVAPGYAQSMRGKLLLFKPAIVSRRNFIPLTQPERTHPVVMQPQSYNEESNIRIPAGFTVDELPAPVEMTTSLGRYTAQCDYDAATHQVRYRRTLVMNAAEIPASEYATVRKFYETIRNAEQAPVVLKRVE